MDLLIQIGHILIAIAIAPHLGIDKKGGFQTIQEYTGFLSPGIFAMFFLGLFWRRTNSMAALFATVGGFFLSIILKFLPLMMDLQFLAGIGFSAPNTEGVYEIPFLDRMSIVFIFCIVGMIVISLSSKAAKTDLENSIIKVNPALFKTSIPFAIGSVIVLLILTFLYTYFW